MKSKMRTTTDAVEISWDADGSFTVVGRGDRRVLGWAPDAEALRTLLRRSGFDIAEATTTLSDGRNGNQLPTYPPQQWRYPFDFSADIDKLTKDNEQLDAVLNHLDQIRREIPDSEPDMNTWIADRARDLQERSPQVKAVEAFGGDHAVEDVSNPPRIQGQAEYCTWIDPRLVLATPDPEWGEFGDRRPETVPTIVRAAREASTDSARRAWVREMFADSPPDVVRVEGPGGPIYSLGTAGSHRTHAARILGLPYMIAEVHVAPLPHPTAPGYLPHYPVDVMELVWRRLLKLGVWTADIVDTEATGVTWLPQTVMAEWMLLAPELAVSVNHSYEQLYPGALTSLTGLPVDQLTDEPAWLLALTTPTRKERAAAFLRRFAGSRR